MSSAEHAMRILSPIRSSCLSIWRTFHSADGAGIVLLKELRSRGVGLIRANPFMAEQLKDRAPFQRNLVAHKGV